LGKGGGGRCGHSRFGAVFFSKVGRRLVLRYSRKEGFGFSGVIWRGRGPAFQGTTGWGGEGRVV
jgi:hypothetical protein